MKVHVLRENLLQGVSAASHVIEIKPNLPIVSNVLVVAKENQLILEATNLETSIRVSIRAKVVEDGRITVPARKLFDYISALSETKLVLLQEDSKFMVRSENSEAEFVTLPTDDFPVFPKAGPQTVSLPSDKLKTLIQKTTFAASSDEVRPVLAGVLLQFGTSDSKIIAVATDGFRLSEVKMGWDSTTSKLTLENMIVPAKSLQEVARAIDGEVITISLSEDQNQLLFVTDEVEIITRLLDVEYPDYQKIIPTEFTTQAVFHREALVNKVKLADIFTRREGRTVRLIFDTEKSRVILRSQSAEVGEHEGELSGEVQGTPMEIAFNAGYLLDALTSIDSEQVRLKLQEGTEGRVSPAAVVPEVAKDDVEYLHIVMPVRLEE